MREIHSLWVGKELGPVEQICLASFIANGHKVFLHAYSKFWVPEGVTVLDARDLVPESRIFQGQNGSLAAFSDYFRLRIIKAYPGAVWVDTDIYCIKPFNFSHPYVLALMPFGDTMIVNMAPFAAPADSELLAEMLEIAENPLRSLPYLTRKDQIKQKLLLLAGRFDFTTLPWGWSAFIPLTKLVLSKGLVDRAAHPQCMGLNGQPLFHADLDYHARIEWGAEYAHFLSSKFWRYKNDFRSPTPGSFFAHCVRAMGERTAYFGRRQRVPVTA